MQVQSQPNKDAAASRLAGFAVLAPAYVPAGYTPGSVQNLPAGWAISHKWGGVAALISYDNQADKSFLTIEELKIGQDKPMTVERPEIEAVTVRGLPGAWMPGLNGDKNALVWDENGITYSVVSNTLQVEELQKVAESLGK